MQVDIVRDDETGLAEYTVEGKDIRVVTQPETDGEVVVEVWDAAGCSARDTRPADQSESIALRTLFTEIRRDEREVAPV